MTTTHPSPLVEAPYATSDLLKLILWAAAVVNFKTSPTDSYCRRQSNGMWNISQYRKQLDHDQQHEQHQCIHQHERPEVRGGDCLKCLRETLGWHLLSMSPHQDCLSNASNGQNKQDLAVQYHQLRKQVQALQVLCHLHPALWL